MSKGDTKFLLDTEINTAILSVIFIENLQTKQHFLIKLRLYLLKK